MKKHIIFSAIATTLLFSNPIKILNSGALAKENGGSKSAIDAYSDGGGVLLANSVGSTAVDNSPMNNLVFKYGTDAKNNSVTLIEQVSLSQNKTSKDIEDALTLDLNNPVVNVADVKSAYLSAAALFKKSAKLPDGTILTFDGTYWKNSTNLIQRYPDVITATINITTRASSFGISDFKATGTGTCSSGSVLTYYNRHTCSGSNTPFSLTCPEGSVSVTGSVLYPSGTSGRYFMCRSSSSVKYCSSTGGYLNPSPTQTYDNTQYNATADLCEKALEGCSTGYTYSSTNHTCTAQLPL